MLLRCFLVFLLLGAPARALADADFGADSEAWNGLRELLRLAEEAGYRVEIPRKVQVDRLTPDDALLIVHPTGELPVDEITSFLRRGGRVAIADDRGSSAPLLDAFQVSRRAPLPSANEHSLRGNPHLLVARPAGTHPLTQGVRALATNHTATLHHAALEPVFVVGPEQEAILLAGAVGQGRLIAIADSSLFINNMLQLDGNRQLARNLLHYLREDHAGRFVWMVGDAAMAASVLDRMQAPIDGARSLFARLAQVRLPSALVILVALALIVFAFLFAASHVPLASPYAKADLFTRAPIIAGFSGRIAFFRRHGDNLLQPLIAFKIELEAELLHRLKAREELALRDVVAAIEARGGSLALCQQTRALLVELDDVVTQHERSTDQVSVSARRFHDLVSRGERILADVSRLE